MASAIGMAPSQGMHAYIGSTLRSMEEVMAGGSAKSPTACLVFVAQVGGNVFTPMFMPRSMRLKA